MVEQIFELGNTTKSRCLEVRVEAHVKTDKRPTEATNTIRRLGAYGFLLSHEDRIVPNTFRKLDTLLTYAHDSNLATAAKQQ